MKFLSAALIALLFTGCEADQEERDFFYSGWVHPEQGANRRMYGTDKAPEDMREGLRQTDLSTE